MNVFLTASLGMVILGLLFGAGLAVASRAFQTQEDERVEEILEALPGINCGACGYGGCRAYAEAVVEGEKVTLCTAGGPDVSEAIAEIMGVETSDSGVQKRAVVHCQGGIDNCKRRSDYNGPEDCRAADLISGGPKECLYGCLGFGTCAEACPYGAITMSGQKLPEIDADKCTACGICVKACPRDLISLLNYEYKTYLGCSSPESGKDVKSVCDVGCITCGLCEKKDPNEAIQIKDGLPQLDYKKASDDFSVAIDVCPMDSYVTERKESASDKKAAGM